MSQVSSPANCPLLPCQQKTGRMGTRRCRQRWAECKASWENENPWVLTHGSLESSTISQGGGKGTRGLASRRGGPGLREFPVKVHWSLTTMPEMQLKAWRRGPAPTAVLTPNQAQEEDSAYVNNIYRFPEVQENVAQRSPVCSLQDAE